VAFIASKGSVGASLEEVPCAGDRKKKVADSKVFDGRFRKVGAFDFNSNSN
jgi:hypothetical protein